MSIMCQDCKNYRVALYPTLTPFIHGYCDELEYPFALAIFKEERPGAFIAPEKCDKHEVQVHD